MEKKSALIIGTSILLGSTILAGSIFFTFGTYSPGDIVNENRYEMISANETNLIIFDKQTGRYWRKFIEPNAGPTEWTEEKTDFLNP